MGHTLSTSSFRHLTFSLSTGRHTVRFRRLLSHGSCRTTLVTRSTSDNACPTVHVARSLSHGVCPRRYAGQRGVCPTGYFEQSIVRNGKCRTKHSRGSVFAQRRQQVPSDMITFVAPAVHVERTRCSETHRSSFFCFKEQFCVFFRLAFVLKFLRFLSDTS